VRPIRTTLAAAAAALFLLAGCSSSTSGSGSAGGGTATGPGGTTASGASGGGQAAGNGVDSLSADEILAKAKTALSSADSVHVHGGGKSGGSAVTMDLKIKGSSGGTGKMSLNGANFEITRIDSTVYLRADEKFYTSRGIPAAQAKTLSTKWIKGTTADKNLAEVGQFTDIKQLTEALLTPDSTIKKGERKTVKGKNAIGITDDTGSTMWISLDGDPVPLQLTPGDDPGDSGVIDFDGYGDDVQLSEPPAAEVIDASQAGQ
jgi:hypothetical protein